MTKDQAHDWLVFEKTSFDEWTQGDSNQEILIRLKKNLEFALEHELTQKQRNYLLDYYVCKMGVCEIAEKYGVNKASVSRSIKSARNNLLHVLRYTDPSLLHCTKLSNIFGKTK